MTRTTKISGSQSEPAIKFLTIAESAALLRVTHGTIRHWLGRGKLRKFKAGARTLLREQDVLSLVKEV